MISLQTSFCRMAVLATLSFSAFSSVAVADVVTVSVTDSPITFVGQLVDENAGEITIETRYGTVVLAKSEIDCKGCSPQVLAQAN